MDKFQEIHGKTTHTMETSYTSSSRGPSPSRPSSVTCNTATTINSQGSNNGRKALEMSTNMKSGRRKSPVLSKRHAERGDKGGGGSTTGAATTGSTTGVLFNASLGTSNNAHLSLNSNLALPVTPSTQSLLSVADERNHSNLQSTASAPTGLLDPSALSSSTMISKTVEDQAVDDDPDVSYFSAGAEGGNTMLDELDGAGGSLSYAPGTPQYHKVRLEMEQIHAKVNKTRESIRDEQTSRDENVNEYLRLASQADKQQQIRLKAVFEKKNTKSAQQMQVLQRKLDTYQSRLKALEAQGIPRNHGHRAPKQVLRGVGMGIKTVMSKPREFAHLIRNKFGSADNINQIRAVENTSSSAAPEDAFVVSPAPVNNMSAGNSNSLPGHGAVSQTIGSSAIIPATSQGSGGGKYTSEEGSECGSSVTSESMAGGLHMSPRHNVVGTNLGLSMGLESFFQELQERREEVDRLREEMEQVKVHLQQEVSFVSAALQEERFRVERLEEQINDLTELHQNEVENLKQNIADMEEKVQYQSEERLRDIHDLLDSCHTRISKVEHQAQHQQHVSLEGIENSNARAVLVKFINMALTLLQLVLVVVSTSANIIAPFLKTRLRVLTTCILAFLFAFVVKQWPDLEDLGSHLIQHWKSALRS
ncbi:transmembrane and coiled-coil domains protein 2-like [Daphnia magna]|uniref:transmembrane and coiled-coil domains protein 2-like n=1 Tax=Daphnia magna TaxID=35525 RepID=UPI0006E0D07E|nr:transmembrane and coiled-coil domains protein 2-like [Daphnia magna]XP_045028832.1 transmembrane and coiled-coil domains protein 2-like [Daphnia magna]XP_045028833.1 transmembrane and coiled-coil domains protein 2-like [Daphnia magna]XP_045028834.1 transmembrane and coiled-coil domains protein 2-like [Daphnia magna]XP_045028835.1 transmembrane and coiled-coil domains protein 2-like [Daphnia magna]XP_045028836.1 transmembrane and coiled-coil domains protein 2-like [Daphnia magna]XP_04502883